MKLLHRVKTASWHRYVAEAFGVCALSTAVMLSIASNLPTPIVAAMVVGIFVYTIGGISGAHLNPAVTVGLASVGKITVPEAVKYIIAQLLGGLLGLTFAWWWLEGQLPDMVVDTSLRVAVAEMLGAFILTFGVSAVVYGKVDQAASGITIGLSLLLGIFVAAGASLGILNPAVALALRAWSVFYFVAPLVGGILGAQLYRWLLRP